MKKKQKNIAPHTSILVIKSNGCNVRLLNIGGDPWFFAKDVCAMQKLKNYTEALRELDNDEKVVWTIDMDGYRQKTLLINESGYCWLALRSRGICPRRLRKWVTSTLLPSICKGGILPFI